MIDPWWVLQVRCAQVWGSRAAGAAGNVLGFAMPSTHSPSAAITLIFSREGGSGGPQVWLRR